MRKLEPHPSARGAGEEDGERKPPDERMGNLSDGPKGLWLIDYYSTNDWGPNTRVIRPAPLAKRVGMPCHPRLVSAADHPADGI